MSSLHTPRMLRIAVGLFTTSLLFVGGVLHAQTPSALPDLALELVSLSGDTAVVYRNDGAAITNRPYGITFQWVDSSGAALAPKQTLKRNTLTSRGRDIIAWNTTMVESTVMTPEQRCYTTGGLFSRRRQCDTIQVPRVVTQALSAYRATRPRPDALLSVQLDDGNQIAEVSEKNNSAQVGNTPFVGLPRAPVAELVITRATGEGQHLFVAFQNQSADAITNQPFDVSIQWLNQTGASTGEKRFIRYKNMPSGKTEVIDSRTGITVLSQTGPGINDVNVAGSLAEYWLQRPANAVQMKITVDERNQILENTKANNVARINLPPIVLPDFSLRSGAYNPSIINVILANDGTMAAPAPEWEFRWIGIDGKTLATSSRITYALRWPNPKQSIPYVIGFATTREDVVNKFLKNPPVGTSTLEIALDPANGVREAREDNNTLRIKLNFPDLILGAVTVKDSTLRIEVQNKGTTPAGPTDVLLQWIVASGLVKSSIPVQVLQPTMPGATSVLNLSLSKRVQAAEYFLALPPPEAKQLQLFVDGSRRIAELNEQNNTTAIDRALVVSTTPADLFIRPLVFNQQQFMVEVMNNSNTPIEKEFVTTFQWNNAASKAVDAGFPVPIKSLKARESTRIIASFPKDDVNGLLGAYLLRPTTDAVLLTMTVDAGNAIVELNEGNNITGIARPAFLNKPMLSLALTTKIIRVSPTEASEAYGGDSIEATLSANNTGFVPVTGLVLQIPCPPGTTYKKTQLNGKDDPRNATQNIQAPDLARTTSHLLTVTCFTEESATVAQKSVRFFGAAQFKGGGSRLVSNNVDVAILPRPKELETLPDLIVQGIGLIPDHGVFKGANIPFEALFTAVISNDGERQSRATRARLRIDQKGKMTWDTIPLTYGAIPEMDADDLVQARWNAGWRAAPGFYGVEVCVDSEDIVKESDETNNCLKEQFLLEVGKEPIFGEGPEGAQ